MTLVKPQISNIQADKSCQVGFDALRLLYDRFCSELSRPNMLAYYMSLYAFLLCISFNFMS
jgi:hypothetical protein